MGHIFIEDAENRFLNRRNITQPWQKEDRLQLQGCMNRRTQGSRDVRGRDWGYSIPHSGVSGVEER